MNKTTVAKMLVAMAAVFLANRVRVVNQLTGNA
jgi:hypothetical protein